MSWGIIIALLAGGCLGIIATGVGAWLYIVTRRYYW